MSRELKRENTDPQEWIEEMVCAIGEIRKLAAFFVQFLRVCKVTEGEAVLDLHGLSHYTQAALSVHQGR